jgi:monovalent cation:H+ antiporter-2, CPA2 family
MEEASLFIRDFGVILLSAALFGWVARSLGQSPIVGYLLAGIIVGTPWITFPYVTDPARIQVFSQLGLVFLMFSIGLGLRIQRLRELGFKVVFATALTAVLVFDISRVIASWMGLTGMQGMFFSAMLTVSSSAIISKTLIDNGLNHTRYGQLGLGITLLEDIVAVVMLTFLGVVSQNPDTSNMLPILGRTLGLLVAFALLMVVFGILILPRLMHRFVKTGSSELETILVAGVLLALSFIAVEAGYSLALGAFLLGIIIAETPRFSSIQQTFVGFRDVFTTVFFVAIGMSLDIGEAGSALPLILIGTAACLIVRAFSAWLSLLIAGEPSRIALQSALVVLPMGEFSFIIAALGVSSGILSETWAVVAVGISFLTSLVSPAVTAKAPGIANALHAIKMPMFSRLLTIYREFWRRVGQYPDRSVLWKLSRKRLIQITLEVVLVSSVMVFAQPGYSLVSDWWPWNVLPDPWSPLSYWVLIHLLCLGPVVAIWRNVSALAMMFSETIVGSNREIARFSPWFQYLFKGLAGAAMALWLSNILPLEHLPWWFIALAASGAAVILALGWRKINRWHSHVEYELQLTVSRNTPTDQSKYLESAEQWGLKLEEVIIPVNTALAGKSIAETKLRNKTGCSIVSLERQGHRIQSPGPQTHLFPGDLVLVAGSSENLREARKTLLAPAPFSLGSDQTIYSDVMELYTIKNGSSLVGKRLQEITWSRLWGIQLLGISRNGERTVFPEGNFRFQEGDTLLLCGNRTALKTLMLQLEPALEVIG